MKEEKSCGAILYYRDKDQPKFLLIQHRNGGHWAFTKGHAENSETEVETALREIKEEVGLDEVALDTNFRSTTKYSPKDNVIKEVVYFIAEVDKEKANSVQCQQDEVIDVVWLSYEEALLKIDFENDRRILNEAYAYLT